MPEIVADWPSLTCYHLLPRPGIQESQWLGPDRFFVSRVGARGALPREALLDELQ